MSSRNRRSQGVQDNNPFSVEDTGPTFESVDRAGYGGPLAETLGKYVNAKPVSIFDIYPDPAQPRRTVPFAVRQSWSGDSIENLFKVWIDAVDAERGNQRFDLDGLLAAEEDDLRDPAPGPLESALLKIVDLAASIKRDGLTNPITVIRDSGGRCFLETGERRWLAYHLLYATTQDKRWEKIPAQIMAERSVWRQAGENNARDDLNAISKARQLAILLMDVFQEQGSSFQPFDALAIPGGCDRAYYEQVADGEVWRVPRGKGEQLVSAMGLKSASQLRDYRRLLRLPDEAWMVADDYNLSEFRLRTILDETDDPARIVRRVKEAAAQFGDTVSTETVSAPGPRKPASAVQNALPDGEPPVISRRDQGKLRKFIKFAGTFSHAQISRLAPEKKREILDWAEHLAKLADDLKRAARS